MLLLTGAVNYIDRVALSVGNPLIRQDLHLSIAEMGVLSYDITKYQPVLFAADGLEHLLDVLGGFFDTCDDDSPARLGAAAPAVA